MKVRVHCLVVLMAVFWILTVDASTLGPCAQVETNASRFGGVLRPHLSLALLGFASLQWLQMLLPCMCCRLRCLLQVVGPSLLHKFWCGQYGAQSSVHWSDFGTHSRWRAGLLPIWTIYIRPLGHSLRDNISSSTFSTTFSIQVRTNPFFSCEPPGPKSRADPPSGPPSRSCSYVTRWLWILMFFLVTTRVGGVRVASDATEAGSQELFATATSGGRLLSTAKKRAFHRAQRRAQTAGGTFYKGRWCTAKSLNVRGEVASANDRAPRPGTFRTWQHNPQVLDLNIVSWNSSGLGAAVLPEFLLWLDQIPQASRPNIVLIQESHWRFTSEYRHGNWLAYHNGVSEGSTDRYAGLLTLIRVPGVSAEQVRVHNVLQGRLTHVRIDLPNRNVDILHVYQHAASSDPSRAVKDKRRRLFNRLDTLIQSMPGRNLLVVGGDFNQPLPYAAPHTGSAICVPSPTNPDHSREGNTLLHIAERHDLVALNTFHCRPSFTYQHCASRTQIDFIFVRSGDAFGRAKRSRPLYDSSLMAWRDTKHHPLIAELSLPRNWWPAKTRSTRYDRAALIQSYNLQTLQYQTFAAAASRHLEDAELSSYHVMRDQLMVCCAEHFPAIKSRVPQPWNHPSLAGSIKRMWAHYKLSRLYQRRLSFDLPTCFAQWHHASRFKAMHREAKRHGRLVKRERYLDQIQQAEEAAASHNAYVLYRIVRRLAPKQRFQSVQIRAEDGSILSHDQELCLLRSQLKRFGIGQRTGNALHYEVARALMQVRRQFSTMHLISPS